MEIMTGAPRRSGIGRKSGESAGQKLHYTAIHDNFEAHYYDASSMKYRSYFIYDWLFEGIDLKNRKIADLACGSGHNSFALIERFEGVDTVGFDISEPACESYRRTTGHAAYPIDLTKPIVCRAGY
jgi:SAM-dependent methyltransferase